MPDTVRPIVVTADISRMERFYTELFDAEVVERYPDGDAALAKVADLGGEAGSGANDMPWGQRVAHVQDPDGNALNLTQQL